jgi:predicted membrane-bound spermidine synthase
MNTEALREAPYSNGFAVSVYLVAFVTGAIVMSFEMLGSRYLAPAFGAGIYTWASLISTVLAALCAGYFLGGYAADRYPSPAILAATVAIGSIYMLLLPAFSDDVVQFFAWQIDDIKLGSLAAATAIMLFPVTFLGMYSPFAIRLLIQSKQNAGAVSGTVYGISTAGSILGTLVTTFFLIPLIGTRAITISLGVLGLSGCALLVGAASASRRKVKLGVVAALLASQIATPPPARAEDSFDPQIRENMLARKDGRIAHLETVYNDIFVTKEANLLQLSFQWKGWRFYQSQTNLADPDDLPMPYSRMMSIAAIFPHDIKRVLVLGLGAGSIPVYLQRFVPGVTIDAVELDPGVIDVAKKYFGLRETATFRLIPGDARMFLNRHTEPYDLIFVDAFTGSYIPFHLMTKEFYQLVRNRLSPRGVAAFNFLPSKDIFESNVRTVSLAFDNKVDLFHSGARDNWESNVIVLGRLDPSSDAETLQKAVAAQQRYKFRFDVSKLVAEQRMPAPKELKGNVLTDDFAAADVLDARGRRYRREK